MARKLKPKDMDRYGSRTSAVSTDMKAPTPSKSNLDADVAKIGAKTKQGMSDAGSFSEAFRAARKDPNNKGTFTWRGTRYTTQLDSEKPKSATPKPAAKSAVKSMTTKAAADRPVAKSMTTKAAADKPAFTPSAEDARADKLRAGIAASRQKAANKTDYSGSAIFERLKDALGVNKARENIANQLQTQAQRRRWADVESQGQRDADSAKRAERIAAGNRPGATMTEKFYAKNPDALKKGGAVKKYAKGGSIDGIAQRGKTRCKGAK